MSWSLFDVVLNGGGAAVRDLTLASASMKSTGKVSATWSIPEAATVVLTFVRCLGGLSALLRMTSHRDPLKHKQSPPI